MQVCLAAVSQVCRIDLPWSLPLLHKVGALGAGPLGEMVGLGSTISARCGGNGIGRLFGLGAVVDEDEDEGNDAAAALAWRLWVCM